MRKIEFCGKPVSLTSSVSVQPSLDWPRCSMMRKERSRLGTEYFVLDDCSGLVDLSDMVDFLFAERVAVSAGKQ